MRKNVWIARAVVPFAAAKFKNGCGKKRQGMLCENAREHVNCVCVCVCVCVRLCRLPPPNVKMVVGKKPGNVVWMRENVWIARAVVPFAATKFKNGYGKNGECCVKMRENVWIVRAMVPFYVYQKRMEENLNTILNLYEKGLDNKNRTVAIQIDFFHFKRLFDQNWTEAIQQQQQQEQTMKPKRGGGGQKQELCNKQLNKTEGNQPKQL